MKKIGKRLFLPFLILALVSMAGFANGKEEPASAGEEEASRLVNGKYNPPVVMNLAFRSTESFREGESVNDNVLTRYVLDRFGIKMNYIWESTGRNNDYENKLRLELASGNPLPDVLYLPVWDQDLIGELATSGLVREVGSLWDEYAGPTWKKAMKQEPVAWMPFTFEGKRMGVPVLDHAMHQEVIMTVRQDWLDNLGLEAPTNLAEFERVLAAFTMNDPDGNGVNDTYGLTMALKDGFYNAAADAGWLFGMHGTLNNYWNDWEKKGTIQYGSIQPGAKEAVGKLREWMEKGYIHKEVALWDGDKARESFAKGESGIIFATRWAHSSIDAVRENVPGAAYESYPIPVGPEGDVIRHASIAVHGTWLINKDFSHPESLFVMHDHFMEEYADPPKGGFFEHGMFENYHYYIKPDGTATTNKKEFPKDMPRVRPYKYYLDPNGARIPNQRLEAYAKVYKGEPLVTPYEIKEGGGAKPYDITTGAVILQQADIRVPNLFLGSPTATMRDKGEFLNKMELETFHKIIYGQEPLSAFDDFVEQWNKLGGQAITQEVNEWYNQNAK